MNIIKDHIPKGTPHNRRPGYSMNPTSITVHSTGNPNSTAKNERAWLTNSSNKRTASYHYVVDDKDFIEVLPPDENAWHAGDGGSGPGNRTSIGVEICESGDRTKALANAVKLIAHLMREYGIEDVVRHYDWSKKICPRIMYDGGSWNGWKNFKNRVMDEYNGASNSNANTKKVLDKVEVTTAHLWTYNSKDWDDKYKTYKEGTTFNVEGDKVKVGGGYMYKLSSGKYITANNKYIKEIYKTITIKKPKEDKNDNGKLYYVQVGAFSSKKNAKELAENLKEKGFPAYIKHE